MQIELTDEERDDIRFALGLVAQQNEDKADDQADLGGSPQRSHAMREQAERFRALARKVTK